MNRSARVRKRLELSQIRVRYVSGSSEAVGQLVNVSRAGLFVKARELPRMGATIAIQFKSPLGPLVDSRGDVRWISKMAAVGDGLEGFGVELREPGSEFREFVSWLHEQQSEKEAEAGDL